MQSSSRYWIALALSSAAATGCTDLGVGDPCIPETIPCSADGKSCGYEATEAYVEASSVQCRSRLCLVYKLDNGTAGAVPSDPRDLCTGKSNDKEGCVTPTALNDSIYCTCRCEGAQRAEDNCSCPDGFTCEQVLTLGGPGIVGSYCVKSSTVNK
ncbi:MAG TPA: hypothetical protein VG963_07865 [Polyangiaceae bacterium]|nr:hypothetical protein [Polyangiaceae bacterium]